MNSTGPWPCHCERCGASRQGERDAKAIDTTVAAEAFGGPRQVHLAEAVEIFCDTLDASGRPRVPKLNLWRRACMAITCLVTAAICTKYDTPVLPVFLTFNAVMFIWNPVPHDYD